jgi:predicted transcriptional regulator
MTETDSAAPSGTCGPGCPTCAHLRRAAVALVGGFGLQGVTTERLGHVAGVAADVLGEHACGAADACVIAAYTELIEGLQARFASRLHAAATRDEGLRDATADLLDHLARHTDVAAFVTVEVLQGGRELLELREALRRRSVANVRRGLARFDGGAVVPELQIEMLVATMGTTIARHVTSGRASELRDAIGPALAMAGACAPLRALI